jgi:hypothetical protein
MRAAILVLALVTTAAAETRTTAQLVGKAVEAMAAIRYDEASKLLDRAWRLGESNPGELRQLFALAGRAAASTGDEAGARTWFTRWLSLDPEAVLPPGTSPKITALLEAVRSKGRLVATAQLAGDRVRVTVTNDPASLVRDARVGTQRARVVDGQAELEAGTVVLLDTHGNTLATIEPAAEPVIVPPVVLPVAETPRRHWYARWSTWAIASGALAAVGGGALYVALDARADLRSLDETSAMHEFSETISLEDRFDRAQLAARIAFVASAVAAVVSVGCYVRARKAPMVSVVPTRGGTVAVLTLGF